MADQHFHVLARETGGEITGDGRRLVLADVAQALDGLGEWAQQPGIAAVLAGRVGVGYAVNPAALGWLCVTACSGADTAGCRDVLRRAVIGGDVRVQEARAGDRPGFSVG